MEERVKPPKLADMTPEEREEALAAVRENGVAYRKFLAAQEQERCHLNRQRNSAALPAALVQLIDSWDDPPDLVTQEDSDRWITESVRTYLPMLHADTYVELVTKQVQTLHDDVVARRLYPTSSGGLLKERRENLNCSVGQLAFLAQVANLTVMGLEANDDIGTTSRAAVEDALAFLEGQGYHSWTLEACDRLRQRYTDPDYLLQREAQILTLMHQIHDYRTERTPPRKGQVTPDIRAELYAQHEAGQTYKEIADTYHIAKSRVAAEIRRHAYQLLQREKVDA